MAGGQAETHRAEPTEVIKLRGSFVAKSRAANIWCCPTSVVTMQSPPVVR
jgi:hypothetical protein